jgi:WD40 repeat protein
VRTLVLLGLAFLADASAPSRSFDPANLGLLRTIAPLAGDLYAVAFSPDGRSLAVGGANEVRLYETRTWRETKRLTGHPNLIGSVAFSPDGKTVAAGGFEGTVLLWDVATAEVRQTIAGPSTLVSALAFSPDGKRLACGLANGLRICEVPGGGEVKTLGVAAGPILAFSPDGTRLAAGCPDNTVKFWNTRGWEQERSVAWGGGVAAGGFLRDARRFWVASEQLLVVGNAETGEREKAFSLAGSTGLTRLSPDGRFAFAASNDGGLGVFDLARRGEEAARLAHHTGAVSALAVHPLGRVVATVGQDRHVKIWGYVAGGMARVRPKGFCGIRVQQNANGDVVIADVIAGTAAAAVGLQAGDVLRKVGGAAIRNTTESVDKISSYMEGDELELEVERSGQPKTYRVKLGKRPQDLEN